MRSNLGFRTGAMMTTSATTRHKFIVYAPDMTDSDAFQRRLSVRQAHLNRAREQVDKGMIST